MPGRPEGAMPASVESPSDSEAGGASHRTRMASAAVPEMQGAPRRVLSDALRPRGIANPRGATAPGRYELLARDDVWAELERCGATIATVPFSGRAGRIGSVERILLSRVQGDELVDVERWSGRDELCYALEAPIWDRFGSFAGQPLIVGTVIWTATDRRVVIEGRRGEKRFEELV